MEEASEEESEVVFSPVASEGPIWQPPAFEPVFGDLLLYGPERNQYFQFLKCK